MRAYYNEFDPKKAAVIREAIKAGAIAAGDVDERSVTDVRAADLRGYTQCHFFAGGGFWSLALRLAGWPDSRPVWTGSCPCPSFSAAGKGLGFADPRHLWPEWDRLIDICRPPVVFGEQVAAAIGHGWLDLVQANMEAKAYSLGAIVLGAHSAGAPHRRQRLWWVADSSIVGSGSGLRSEGPSREGGVLAADSFGDGSLAVSHRSGAARYGRDGGEVEAARRLRSGSCDSRGDGFLGESEGEGLQERELLGGVLERAVGAPEGQGLERASHPGGMAEPGRTSTLKGFWGDADWLFCTDGRWRPVAPGSFPLVNGYSGRVAALRLAGDAIVIPLAVEFIQAYCER